MCLSPEQHRLWAALNLEEQCRTPEQMRLGPHSQTNTLEDAEGWSLPDEVRRHHADLAYRATRSPEGRAAFDAHRAAHREEALRLRAERQK